MITVIKTCDHCKKEVTHLYEWPRFRVRDGIISISEMGTYQYCKDCSALLISKIDAWQELKDDSCTYIKLMAQRDK